MNRNYNEFQRADCDPRINLGNGSLTAADYTKNGRAIRGARILLVGASGETSEAITNLFGYYRFEDVSAGATYVISVSHKRYRFAQSSQVLTLLEDAPEINFTSEN